MIKLQLRRINEDSVVLELSGPGKLGYWRDSGMFINQGLPGIGKEVLIQQHKPYYLTDKDIIFLKKEIDEYLSNRRKSNS